MSHRVLGIATLASFALCGLPFAASAQTGTFFTPAKLLTNGTNTTPTAGKGTVLVKVFVRANGTVDVSQTTVSKSTNPGDNAAAIEVANTAKYRPAARDGKPEASYYTYTLNITGTGASASDDTSNADLKRYSAMTSAGNYAGAKAGLLEYLKTNPSDPQANLLLGVADYYGTDYASAAKDFDLADTIPQKYKVVAGDAFLRGAEQALRNNALDGAFAYATKAIDMQPSVAAYNTRGNAEIGQKKYADAATDIEKARALLLQGKPDNAKLAQLDANLAAAYLGAGQSEKGLAAAKEAQKLDPSVPTISLATAQYYNDKANAALKAGNTADAIAQFEAGATAVPSQAVVLLGNAALSLAKEPKPDWKHVKAEADKALAIDPTDARANYVAGLALANDGHSKDALPYFTKAQASAKNGTDTELSARIDLAIKQVNGAK